ncbi:lysozyme inhibitor LprI family protein [Methylobacterium bullatum]
MAEFERGGCYSDVVRGLTTQLKAEIAKKLVQINSIADDKPEAGILAGKENAAKWRADFLLAQKLWEDYSKRQCQNYVDYENYGGSGAYQAALGCEIRHLVARLNEVRSST